MAHHSGVVDGADFRQTFIIIWFPYAILRCMTLYIILQAIIYDTL